MVKLKIKKYKQEVDKFMIMFDQLKSYFKHQRTDTQPIFFARMRTFFGEMNEQREKFA